MKTIRSWLFTGALLAATSASAQLSQFMIVLEGSGFPPLTLRQCSGIGSYNDVVEQRVTDPEGGEIIRKVPGPLHYFDLVCARGMSTDLTISDWRKLVEDGRVDMALKDLVLTLYDETFTEVARWNLTNAWPSKLVVDLEGTTPIETLTIVSESFVRTL